MIIRYIRALFLSFFSATFYREVLHEWRGAAVGYLLFLSLLTQIPSAVKTTGEAYLWTMDHRGHAFFQQIPAIRIESGELKTDVETPYEIKDPETGDVAVILDPEETIDIKELPTNVMLLGQRELWVRNNRGQLRSVPYEGFGDFTFNRDKARQWAQVGSLAIVPLVYLLGALLLFAWRIILSLALAGISVAPAKRILPPPQLAERMRLCAVALTPAVLLSLALDWPGLKVPNVWLISLLMNGFYVYFALRSNMSRQDEHTAGLSASSAQ